MIEDTIKNLKENIADYTLDELGDKEWELTRFYAQTSVDLAQVKAERAKKMLDIQQAQIIAGGRITEKSMENEYYVTEEGRYLVKNEILLKAIGRLISSIRRWRTEEKDGNKRKILHSGNMEED